MATVSAELASPSAKAQDTELGRFVALKFLPDTVDHTHSAAAKFSQDAVMRDGLSDKRVDPLHVLHILGWGQEASQRRGATPANQKNQFTGEEL